MRSPPAHSPAAADSVWEALWKPLPVTQMSGQQCLFCHHKSLKQSAPPISSLKHCHWTRVDTVRGAHGCLESSWHTGWHTGWQPQQALACPCSSWDVEAKDQEFRGSVQRLSDGLPKHWWLDLQSWLNPWGLVPARTPDLWFLLGHSAPPQLQLLQALLPTELG